MPKPDRHKQILAAALQSFIQHGFAGTSMGDIARRAHLSRSLLYLQFASKEDLFGALVEELLDEHFERAMRVLGTRGSRRERLLGVIEAWDLQLYERIAASPHGDELFAAAWKLRPRLEATHRRRTQELFGGLIEDEARREVFLLALKGMTADRPRIIDVLRRRVEILVDLVLRSGRQTP